MNTAMLYSQVPQSISYQSIAYNSSNMPIVNGNIGIKISILDLSSTGSVLYSERHNKTTNSQGNYSLSIGAGTVLSGSFNTIPWGVGNKFLKVELDPIGGTNYTASGTTQFMSVPYALSSGTTINGIKIINNIQDLRLAIGNSEGDVCYVKDYIGNNDGGGGHFVWRINGFSNLADNGGTIIVPGGANPTNGRWVRNVEGTAINVKWFGILGDGVTDYSPQLEGLIATFNSDNRGVKVLFPKGIYRLKNIEVPTGFTFYGEQGVSHDLSYLTPVIIRPAFGAQYVFKFSTSTTNASLENLNIDGDFQNPTGQSLIAGVLFNGTANRLYNNNIVYCKQHAVKSTSLKVSRIENNMLQGLFGSGLPYANDSSPDNGHIGSLHLTNTTDSWIINNEIGMATSYGTLKDLTNRKAVAILGNNLHNSIISGNVFENGDKGAYIMYSTQNRFSNNRYEFNGSSGMEILNNAESIFTGEFFCGNSLSQGGGYDDLTIDTSTSVTPNQSSGLTFINPTFVKGNNGGLTQVGIDPESRLPRHNVTNYASNSGDWKITFVAPYFQALSRNKDAQNNSLPAVNTNTPAQSPYMVN